MARSNKFDFGFFLRFLPRPIVETLYEMWQRLGGGSSTDVTLTSVNTAVTTATNNTQVAETESVNIAQFKVAVKRLEKRVTQLESQIDR